MKTQASTLQVTLATRSDQIEQALRLRYKVFMEEEQNRALYNPNGIEQDEYDEYCDHLIVTDLKMNEVVGTYRLLPGERALSNIGFYSETEFDLTEFPLSKLHTLELGRSCVALSQRGGKAIQLLWEGISNYIHEHGYKYLIGCASLHLKTLQEVNELYSLLRMKGSINDDFGVRPLESHRITGLQKIEIPYDEKEILRRLPPLMKGYQWLGAEIGGDPAYDPLFDSIDYFIVLQTDHVTRKYRRRFLGN